MANTTIQQLSFRLHRKFNDGGKIEIVYGYKKKADHRDLLSISRFFAQKGDNVKMTTNIHFKDKKYKEVFGELMGTKHDRKCPDLIINGKFYEYESFIPPITKRNLNNMFTRGLSQSSNIIINNNKGMVDRIVRKMIFNRIRLGQTIGEEWLYEKGKVQLLYKKQ
jgi:hypothetical protein